MSRPTSPDRFWQGLRDGEVGLSEIAASRLGVAAGDTVELPTVEGPKRYRVAGIVRPQMVNDAAVGDIVLVSEGLARSDWAAVRDQVAVAYPSSADATAHRDDFLDLGAGLWVYDNEAVALGGHQRDHPLLGADHDRGVRGDGGRRPERAERVRAGTRATQA